MAASPAFRILDTKHGDRVLPLYVNAGAPTNGVFGTGTFAGAASIGALLEDSTNGALYINTGTKASPVWTIFGTGGTGAYAGTFDGLVGSVTPADGTFTTVEASGIVTMGSIATGLTAVGTTRADALALTKQFNVVSTVGATTAGVILPASAVGVGIYVWDSAAANAMHIYAAGSDTIDGTAGSTGVVMAHGKGGLFMCVAANTYVSFAAVNSA